jgi:flagellar biosynthesis anti-sigma factor FlgM
MKIGSKFPSQPQSPGKVDSAKTDKSSGIDILDGAKGADGPRKSDSARVELSKRSQDIKRAKELATPSDGIDEAKVARLQKLIDEGNYRIDAEAIADRLVGEQMKMN